MKKSYIKYILISFITSLLIIILVVVIRFTIWLNQPIIDISKYSTTDATNDAYADYVCRDYHLVCTSKEEYQGVYSIDYKGVTYRCDYYSIEGVSDEQFIFARVQPRLLGVPGENYILQSPENEIDVLDEWTMRKYEIYYTDSNEEENQDVSIYDDREELIKRVVLSDSKEDVLQELKETLANVEEETNFRIDSGYKRIYPGEAVRYYLRIYFDEAEEIVWETKLVFYQSKTDDSDIIIILDNGTFEDINDVQSHKVGLDPSSDVYEMIWNLVKSKLVEVD